MVLSWFVVAFVVALLDSGENAFTAPVADVALSGGFWDMEADRMTYDQGRYEFQIGSSSQDIRGTVSAVMSGRLDRRLKTVWAAPDTPVLRIGQTTPATFTACMNDDSFYEGAKAVWT